MQRQRARARRCPRRWRWAGGWARQRVGAHSRRSRAPCHCKSRAGGRSCCARLQGVKCWQWQGGGRRCCSAMCSTHPQAQIHCPAHRRRCPRCTGQCKHYYCYQSHSSGAQGMRARNAGRGERERERRKRGGRSPPTHAKCISSASACRILVPNSCHTRHVFAIGAELNERRVGGYCGKQCQLNGARQHYAVEGMEDVLSPLAGT